MDDEQYWADDDFSYEEFPTEVWMEDEQVWWDPFTVPDEPVQEESFWDKLTSFGKGAVEVGGKVLDVGSKVYTTYLKGKSAGNSGLTYALPTTTKPQALAYDVQTRVPTSPGSQISIGGTTPLLSGVSGGSGINMNLIIIGGVVLAAVFLLKGK